MPYPINLKRYRLVERSLLKPDGEVSLAYMPPDFVYTWCSASKSPIFVFYFKTGNLIDATELVIDVYKERGVELSEKDKFMIELMKALNMAINNNNADKKTTINSIRIYK